MRLKEDKSSWKSGGVRAKDTRNARDDLKEAPKTKKKNTKQWCKGKIGVEHEPIIKDGHWYNIELRCKKCEKKLDWKIVK